MGIGSHEPLLTEEGYTYIGFLLHMIEVELMKKEKKKAVLVTLLKRFPKKYHT